MFTRRLTEVFVENLIFGTRGSFRTPQPPAEFAEFALFVFQAQEPGTPGIAPPEKEIYQLFRGVTLPVIDNWCDHEPVGLFVLIDGNVVLLRYHCTGDPENARRWLQTNDHILCDGRIGPHVARDRREVV